MASEKRLAPSPSKGRLGLWAQPGTLGGMGNRSTCPDETFELGLQFLHQFGFKAQHLLGIAQRLAVDQEGIFRALS